MFISHAQNFEDVILWRALKHIKNGFYIDIGAQHPIEDSVSRGFYDQGWRGLHIEPSPEYAELLRENRPDETVLQYAIGNEITSINFYNIPDSGLSTASKKIADQHLYNGFKIHEISVKVVGLDQVFSSYSEKEIHWLKIDVEGCEQSVLESWKSSEVRPWILLIESTLPLTQSLNHFDWESYVIEKGYRFVYFDGLNRYYLHAAHMDLRVFFKEPPNIFDNFLLSGTQCFINQELNNLRLNKAIAEANSLRVELDHQLNFSRSIQSSISWKITAPLRWTKKLFLSLKPATTKQVATKRLKLRNFLLKVVTKIDSNVELKKIIRTTARKCKLEWLYIRIVFRLGGYKQCVQPKSYLQMVKGFDDLSPNGKLIFSIIDAHRGASENGDLK
jgi:FkbM family methyltransferase